MLMSEEVFDAGNKAPVAVVLALNAIGELPWAPTPIENSVGTAAEARGPSHLCDRDAIPHFHTEVFEVGPFTAEYDARQTVIGDANRCHASGFAKPFKDGHGISHLNKIIGTGALRARRR